MKRPTYTIEQLDNRLKQVEYRLKKSQEQEKAKREHLFKDLESRCFQCGHTGHLKNECRTRFQAGRPQEKNLEPVNVETLEKMDKIKCTRLYFAGKGIVIPVTVNDIGANGVVDTGADATVISSNFASVAGIDTKGCKKACLLNAEDGA